MKAKLKGNVPYLREPSQADKQHTSHDKSIPTSYKHTSFLHRPNNQTEEHQQTLHSMPPTPVGPEQTSGMQQLYQQQHNYPAAQIDEQPSNNPILNNVNFQIALKNMIYQILSQTPLPNINHNNQQYQPQWSNMM